MSGAENKHNSWSRMHSQPRKAGRKHDSRSRDQGRVGLYFSQVGALFLVGGVLIDVWW
jgi:hypothetical protein